MPEGEYSIISGYYQYFYSRVTSNHGWIFTPSDKEKAMIGTFIDDMSKHGYKISDAVLFRFFSYQFGYWTKLDTRFGSGKVMLGWVIGKKAIRRWKDSEDGDTYSAYKFLREKFGIVRDDIIHTTRSSGFDVTALSVIEDNDRKMYLNTPEGLAMCMDYTTLYHPKSSSCAECKYAGWCKKLLARLYPRVYSGRMTV